jgi:hypothetical protein
VKERERRKKKLNHGAVEEDERVKCNISVMQRLEMNSNNNKLKYIRIKF